MKLPLIPNWRQVLRHATSSKLMMLTVALLVLDIVLGLVVTFWATPLLRIAAALAALGSIYARLVLQPMLHKHLDIELP